MSIDGKLSLFSLPNEILLDALSFLTTESLLPLALVSRRFYAQIHRILQQRLTKTTVHLTDYYLLLECYHPTAKLSEPCIYGTLQGTPGLAEATNSYYTGAHGDGNGSRPRESLPGHLGELRILYSRYKLHHDQPSARRPRFHPAGDIPGTRTFDATFVASTTSDFHLPVRNPNGFVHKPPCMLSRVSLDTHELFTQLCAGTNLIEVGPRAGLFHQFIEIEHERALRVWRGWLRQMAAGEVPAMSDMGSAPQQQQRLASRFAETKRIEDDDEEDAGRLQDDPEETPRESKSTANEEDPRGDTRILWTTPAQNVGLKFGVREVGLRSHNQPILMCLDEDLHVTYELEYQEVLIRTSHMLLTLERELPRREQRGTKAVVIGALG